MTQPTGDGPKIRPGGGVQRSRSPARVATAVAIGLVAGTAAFGVVWWTVGHRLPTVLNVLIFGALVLVALFGANSFIAGDIRSPRDGATD